MWSISESVFETNPFEKEESDSLSSEMNCLRV